MAKANGRGEVGSFKRGFLGLMALGAVGLNGCGWFPGMSPATGSTSASLMAAGLSGTVGPTRTAPELLAQVPAVTRPPIVATPLARNDGLVTRVDTAGSGPLARLRTERAAFQAQATRPGADPYEAQAALDQVQRIDLEIASLQGVM